jgi:hypothetical protein
MPNPKPNREEQSGSDRILSYAHAWDRGHRRLLIDIINLEIDLEIGDRDRFQVEQLIADLQKKLESKTF